MHIIYMYMYLVMALSIKLVTPPASGYVVQWQAHTVPNSMNLHRSLSHRSYFTILLLLLFSRLTMLLHLQGGRVLVHQVVV